MKLQKASLFLVSLSFVLAAGACKKKSSSKSSDDAGKLAIGETMIGEVKTKLKDAGYSEKQTDAVAAGALSGLEGAALAGFAIADNAASHAGHGVAHGAIAALAGKGAGMEDDADKIKAAKIIGGACLSALADLDDKLSTEEIVGVAGAVSGAAVGSLGDADIDQDSYSDAMKGILGTITENLDDAGLKDLEDLKQAAGSMIEEGLPALKDLGLSDDELASFSGDITNGTLSGFDELGFDEAGDLTDIASFLMDASMDSLHDTISFDDEEYIQQLMKELSSGFSSALGEFSEDGLFDLDTLAEILGDFSQETSDNLQDFLGEYEFDNYDEWASEFSDGVMVGCSEAGLDTGELATLEDEVSAGACEGSEDADACGETVNDGFDDLLAEYQAYCEEGGGTWELDGEYYSCSYPDDESGPTVEITYDGALSFADGAGPTVLSGTVSGGDIVSVTLVLTRDLDPSQVWDFYSIGDWIDPGSATLPESDPITVTDGAWSYTVVSSGMFQASGGDVFHLTVTAKDSADVLTPVTFDLTNTGL